MAIGKSIGSGPFATCGGPGLLFPQNDDLRAVRQRVKRALIDDLEFVRSGPTSNLLIEQWQSLIETGWTLPVVLLGPELKGLQPVPGRIEFCKGLFVEVFPLFQRAFRFRDRPLRAACCRSQYAEFVRLPA